MLSGRYLSRSAFTAVVTIAAVCFSKPAEAEWCQVGTQVTLQMKLDEPISELASRNQWVVLGRNPRPCFVHRFYGNGKSPPGCTVGKTLEASGTVKNQEGLISLLLDVTSARCF